MVERETKNSGDSEEQRRHRIYFQINDQDSYTVGKLTTSQYVELKHNDQSLYDFVLQLYEAKKISIVGGEIETLFRSIDDVDYTPIELPSRASNSTKALAGSAYSSDNAKESQPPIFDTSDNQIQELQDSSKKSIAQSQTAEPAEAASGDEICKTTKNSQPLRGKKASQVWTHFKKESESTARCIICNKVIKHCGNTTNLKQHLNRKHALLCPSVGEQKRSYESSDSSESVNDPPVIKRMKFPSKGNKLRTIDEAFERVNSFGDGGKTADKITNAILYMVAVDEQPFSTIENEGFKLLMRTVAPLYTIPSRRSLTKLMDTRYEVFKERCINNLQKVESFSLTCDIWTDNSNQSYLGVTIHYLSEQLVMKNRCLGVIPLHESHTAEYLGQALNSVIDDFNLDRAKIMAVVCDNGANIKKAVCQTVGKDKHLTCYAHTLSHLVPDAMTGMPVLTEIIIKVKNIVTLVRRSIVASDELKRLQIRDGKSDITTLKFVQDVPTRWKSTLYMLERFLLLKDYVYPVLSKCPNSPDMLRREEIEIIKDIISLMKPVENVIREVSGDTYPTCSIIIPIIRCMEATIQGIQPETEVGLQFKNKLQLAVQARFKDFELHPILGVSAVLDPRFKKMHFNSALAASTAITRINNKIKENLGQQITEATRNDQAEHITSPNSIWDVHDVLMTKNPDVSTHNESTLLQVRQYLSQPVVSRLKNPFTHWKTLEHAYPALFKLAMRYLSIVGTSVSSERMFSHAGLIKTQNRNRLSGEHLNKLLFLKSLTPEEWGMV